MSSTTPQQAVESARPFCCTEPDCSKRYASDKGLKGHIWAKHRTPEVFQCDRPNCSKGYPLKKILDKHIALVHERHMPKEIIEIIVADARNYLKSNEKYTCPCGESTASRAETVRTHLLTHPSPEFIEAHRKLANDLNPVLGNEAAFPKTMEEWWEWIADFEAEMAGIMEGAFEPIIWDDRTQTRTAQELQDVAAAASGGVDIMDE